MGRLSSQVHPGRDQVLWARQSQQLAVLRGQVTGRSLARWLGPLHTAVTLPTHCWKRDQGVQSGPCHPPTP